MSSTWSSDNLGYKIKKVWWLWSLQKERTITNLLVVRYSIFDFLSVRISFSLKYVNTERWFLFYTLIRDTDERHDLRELQNHEYLDGLLMGITFTFSFLSDNCFLEVGK